MEISYGLVNLMYFMLSGELNRIKGPRSNKRRKLLICLTHSLFKVYNNLSCGETGSEVYNISNKKKDQMVFWSSKNKMKFSRLGQVLVQKSADLCKSNYPANKTTQYRW